MRPSFCLHVLFTFRQRGRVGEKEEEGKKRGEGGKERGREGEMEGGKETERERETDSLVCCSTYLCIHWLKCPDRESNTKTWHSG